MNVLELKSDLHKLLEKVEDEQLLRALYDFLMQGTYEREGQVWSELTDAQRKEVFMSYEESKEGELLKKWEDVKKKY